MKSIFITGTDTGVGKTIFTGLLGRFLISRGKHVITQKWIQTGSPKFPDDINTHLKLMNCNKSTIKEYLRHICSYNFKFPASAHLASRLENKTINPDKIIKSFKILSNNFDTVIVEGMGGALVPFNQNQLVIDIAIQLKLPVLIIAGNKLGAINHTILTIEALRKRKMKILGMVFNNLQVKTDDLILKDNPKIVQKITSCRLLGTLPWIKDKHVLYEKFIPIARKVIKYG